MIAKLAIVTDSLACLPKNEAEKNSIYVVPSSVIIGDHIYLDGIDITPGEVYDLQRRKKFLPTTSAASPWELMKIYHEASENADEILYVCITPKLTMAYESAVRAKEIANKEIPNVRIEVLDTESAAGAQGLMAIAAARVATSGEGIDDAIAVVKQLMEKTKLFVIVDTLYFLAKGGRVPKIAAWASSLLSIKPVLQLTKGETIPLERVRTKPKATSRMIDIVAQNVGDKIAHMNLMHAGVPDEAEELKKQITARFNCAELFMSEFSPAMGAHTGPGLLGIAFYCDD